MKKLIFLLLLSIPLLVKAQENRQYIGVSRGLEIYYLLTNTVRISPETSANYIGHCIEAWVEVPNKTYKGKGKIYKNATELTKYTCDCQTYKIKSQEVVLYNSEKEVIVTKEASILDEYTSVIPGSIGEGIFNAICEYYNNN